MSSGKKGKKNKGVTLALGDFLGATASPGGGNASVAFKSKSNWADETDEFEEDLRPTERITLPTAPRQARGPDIDPDMIPHKPPFTAYIANLPFEVDDEEIERFFDGLQVKSVRLPKEGGEQGRFKGFGYVEFETRNDLVEALNKNEDQMGNRKIRVDIAEGESGARKGGGFSDRGPREEFEDRSGGVSDWRRAPPPERSERSPPRRTGGFEDRGGDDRRGGGGGFGDRDRSGGGGFGDRDRSGGGGFGDRDRSGGFGDRDRDRGGGFGDRNRDGGGGFGDRDRGGRDRDRDGGGGGGFRDRDRDGGDGWRPRGTDGGDKDGAPKERPKLNLKPRTGATSEGKPASSPSGGGGGGGGGGGSSIFGNAKPVDTLKREVEMESKLGTKTSPAPPKRTTGGGGGGGGGSIFGDAKPVDTASKERKIADKLIKTEPARSSERRDVRREDGDRRDDRGRDDRRDDGGRDDRRDDRGRDDRRDDGGRDERRDDGGRDERRNDGGRDERRDDGGRDERRDDGGRDDRRDDRGRDDGRDDRGRDDGRDDRIRDIRGGSRDIRLEQNNREPSQEGSHNDQQDNKEPPPPRMKTLEDDTPVLDTTNKFAGLGVEEEEA